MQPQSPTKFLTQSSTSARKIFKYPLVLVPGQPQALALPLHGKIIGAEIAQDPYELDLACHIWVEFEDILQKKAEEVRCFCLQWTGQVFSHDGKHLYTIRHGELVWHLYELPNHVEGTIQ